VSDFRFGRVLNRFYRTPRCSSAMRLATITNWAYGLTVFLALAAGTTTILASNAQEDERAAVAQRYRLDQATSIIAAEVTALSEQAREYVITGDSIHMVLYRREA